ncbi:S1 family peptidase [Enterovibrio norvegicus]|uniref:S1 family peptidase n=1 Tax=Enterovibrio norvegicus TaxID=188144 RepID=UPI0024B2606C|nr:serine protease [Enterovibrio norvegicus]
MTETLVKRATCSIRCGEDSGTGWLVTDSLVITAYHCICESIVSNESITLRFEIDGEIEEVNASLLASDEQNDVCILVLERSLAIEPILLNDSLPSEGARYFSYGFPVTKLTVGHIVHGKVSQVLDRPKLKIDLDLHVGQSSSLTAFKGISGAALMFGNRCKGILRLSVDKALGAISIATIADFLRENNVPIHDDSITNSEEYFVPREAFTSDFEALIENIGHGYGFIDGSQGIGKSTFCQTYSPVKNNLTQIAAYSFTSKDGSSSAMHKALPEVFFDWLSTLVSSHLWGKAGRASPSSYREIIEGVAEHIRLLGDNLQSQGKIGVIFIDGLDEVANIGIDILSKFINIFPEQIPKGLVFVFSAPNYESLEQALSTRVKPQSCITMPRLEHGAVRSYCFGQLSEDYCNTEIVSVICERAQGHPLYLHYLIDLANGGSDSAELSKLPLINGSIRNYYDVLWSRLRHDHSVVELLAIITRLRWGLPWHSLSAVLNESEKAALNVALSSIRHLIRANEVAIYHSSFSDYITEKTELRDSDIHLRLSQFCASQMDTRYGLLNVMYHSLRSGSQNHEDFAVSSCDQGWADKCVLEGVEPDLLLQDLREVLTKAVEKGVLQEVIRLLLLSNRLSFRYNTLFAISAELIGEALISLGKPRDALQHVVRYGQLIIDPHESIWLAIRLIEAREHEAALGILEKAEIKNDKTFEASEKSFEYYFDWYESQVQIQTLKSVAGDTEARDILQHTMYISMKLVSKNIEDEEVRQATMLDLLSLMLTCSLCFESRYTPVSVIREKLPLEGRMFLETLLRVIVNYRFYCETYEVMLDMELLQVVFLDIQGLLDESGMGLDGFTVEAVDCVISLGAPLSIVKSISNGLGNLEQSSVLSVLNDNKVSIDKHQLRQDMATLRVMAFLNANLSCKTFPDDSQLSWQKKYETLIHTLAWAEGAARRAKDCDDNEKLSAIWQLLEFQFFHPLAFSLSQRADWEDSYAIPEELSPIIYSVLTDFLIDVYPEKLGFLLSFVDEHFSNQCGVYSEGFRRVLAGVLTRISKIREVAPNFRT